MIDASQHFGVCPSCKNPVAEQDESCRECMAPRGPGGWPADPYTGASLAGRFAIERRIGADGTGLTFIGAATGSGDKVVVRMLSPDLASTADLSARFLAEVRKVRDLRDPLFPSILDVGAGFGQDVAPYFVREYVEGESLARLLSRDLAFDVPETLEIASRIASGMHRAHARGLIHRHLRPDKIVFRGLRDADPVKILDMGFSQIAPLDEVTSMGHVDALRYAPPAADRDTPADAKADVYALGVLMYDMVSGLPEMRPSVHGSGREPERLSVHRPTLSRGLDDLVYRMMAREPADRPATMAEVLRAIEKVRKAEPVRIVGGTRAGQDGAARVQEVSQPGKLAKAGGRIIGGSRVARKPNPTPVLKMASRANLRTGDHGLDLAEELTRPTLSPPAPDGKGSPAPAEARLDLREEIDVADLFGTGDKPILQPPVKAASEILVELPSLPPLPPSPGDGEDDDAMEVRIEDAELAVALSGGVDRSEQSTSLTPLSVAIPSPEKRERSWMRPAVAILAVLLVVPAAGVSASFIWKDRAARKHAAQPAPQVEAKPAPPAEADPAPPVEKQPAAVAVPPPVPPPAEASVKAGSDGSGDAAGGTLEKKKKKKKALDEGQGSLAADPGESSGSKDKGKAGGKKQDDEWERLFTGK